MHCSGKEGHESQLRFSGCMIFRHHGQPLLQKGRTAKFKECIAAANQAQTRRSNLIPSQLGYTAAVWVVIAGREQVGLQQIHRNTRAVKSTRTFVDPRETQEKATVRAAAAAGFATQTPLPAVERIVELHRAPLAHTNMYIRYRASGMSGFEAS